MVENIDLCLPGPTDTWMKELLGVAKGGATHSRERQPKSTGLALECLDLTGGERWLLSSVRRASARSLGPCSCLLSLLHYCA